VSLRIRAFLGRMLTGLVSHLRLRDFEIPLCRAEQFGGLAGFRRGLFEGDRVRRSRGPACGDATRKRDACAPAQTRSDAHLHGRIPNGAPAPRSGARVFFARTSSAGAASAPGSAGSKRHWGALLFGYFLLGTQEKVTSRRAAPGLQTLKTCKR
jgi:hypothetical protein